MRWNDKLGNPEDLSDGNKLRLLADVIELRDHKPGQSTSVQDDLRRIAERLDAMDRLDD